MGDHPFRFTIARTRLASAGRYAVAALAFTLLAIPSFADAAQQRNPQRKVWTNEDVERLKDRDAISIVGLGPDDDFSPAEPTAAQQGAKQKVWTNEDLEKLRNPDGLSIVPSAEEAPAQPSAPATAAPATPAAAAASAEAACPEVLPYDQFTDPGWYAEQAYGLRVELAEREARLGQYLHNIQLARDAITQPGMGMFSGDVGITLEAGVQELESQIQNVLIQLDKLANTARRNGIEPGVLRG